MAKEGSGRRGWTNAGAGRRRSREGKRMEEDGRGWGKRRMTKLGWVDKAVGARREQERHKQFDLLHLYVHASISTWREDKLKSKRDVELKEELQFECLYLAPACVPSNISSFH
eukprot:766143-Hanusia_phi.AAC.3